MATQPPEPSATPDESSHRPGSLERQLENLTRLAAERQARRTDADRQAELDAEEARAAREQALKQRYHPSTAAHTRLAAAERDLKRLEGQGHFVSYPLKPENEFPTLLTRLPIFRPTRRTHQQRLQDIDNALAFSTPFGEGKRHGPPLTVRDEDTLIALMRLRSKRMYGRPKQLPVEIADIYEGKGGRVGVHTTLCTLDDILTELKLTDGGANYQRTFESIKRLGATTLELNLKTHDRYLGSVQTGRMVQLMHVQWQVYDKDGLIVVLFPPVIAQWLDEEYTYIDFSLRLQLDDLGKCLHRFLSGQPKRYHTQALKLADTIGYDGPAKNLKQRLGKSLDRLMELEWLKAYEWRGNGRKTPLTLHIDR